MKRCMEQCIKHVQCIKLVWLSCILVFLAVGCISGCGAKNGSQAEVDISGEDLTNAMDICADQKNKIYYVAAKEKILTYDDEGKPGKIYNLPDRMIAQVAYSDGLYALDIRKQSVLKLNKGGEVEGEYPLNVQISNPIDFEAVGSDVYLSTGVGVNNDYKEYTYVLFWENQQMKVFLEKGVLMADEGSLLTYQQGRRVSYPKSAKNEKDGEDCGSLGNGYGSLLTSFCVDSHQKYYYCTDQKVIMEENGTSEILHRMNTDYDVVATCGDTVLLLKRTERLTLVTKQAYKEEYEQTLTLYGVGTKFPMPDGTERNLAEEFGQTAKVNVEYVSAIGMNPETFLTNLMSGSDRYDMYALGGVNENAFHYVKNHAYVDLSVKPEIVEKMDLWYAPIVEGCTYQGELFAVPGGTGEEVLYCNLADYPELAEEDFSTWDAFLDVIEKYDENVLFNEIRLRTVLLEQYIATYCDTLNGEYEFDIEAFRKVLQLLRRIEGMDIRYYEGEGAPELFENGELLGFGATNYYMESGKEFLPLPSICGETSVSPLKIRYCMINPNSSQIETALEYTSLLAECGSYAMKETADQYPLIAELYENHVKCIFGSHADYGTALEEYITGTMTEDEAIAEITELTRRRQNQ